MVVPDNRAFHLQAAEIIRSGGVIAFRTDTFYGLGADPFRSDAIHKIREHKRRADTNPILLLIADATEVERFIVSRSEVFESVAKRFWPGPLTLIGAAHPDLPEGLTAGTKTIGLRLPDDEDVRELVRVCGGALTATSANPSGQPPARTAEEVENYFSQGIDLIIDCGAVTVTEPSSVLDLSGTRARLIREGAISREALQEFL